MNWNNVLKLRMKKLGFSNPACNESEYDELFRRLQPVSTEYFTEPGRPPSIRDRALIDDIEYNRLLRQNQDIIKARFQGNTISYVCRDELELYAAAFSKPLSKMDDTSMELFTVLDQVGPMDKKQIMEELDLKGPVVTKILQKFQKAFLVYELQPDRFGEQVWQTFNSEWSEFNFRKYTMEEARMKIVLRFIGNMVIADKEMVGDWTRFTKTETVNILNGLDEKGIVNSFDFNGDTFYFQPGDKAAIFNRMMVQVPKSIFIIHKADYLYRAYESRLKTRYKGMEILQYVLIDGEIKGAVEGHWRIGPHNIENIIMEIPEKEAAARKDEIIAAVAELYHPPYSRILKYNGKPL